MQLAQEIEDLQALTQAQLPKHTPLLALFEIDITDTAAVAKRIEDLQARLAPPAPSADGAAAPAAPTPTQQRDRLRLQFLQLPSEARSKLIDEDRLQRERAALAEQQAAARQMQEAAEQQRNAALQAAQEAASAAERELAIETARLQSHRAELAALAQSWNSRNQSELDLLAQQQAHYQPKDAAAGYGSAEADRLYNDIREDLKVLRKRADEKLSLLDMPSKVASLASLLPLDNPNFAPFAEQRVQLVTLRARIADEELALRSRESDDRYRDAQEVMQSLKTLQAQRITLHEHLSPGRRAAVSGLTEEGLSRIRGELSHITLMARWYPQQRRHAIAELPDVLRDVFTAGKLGLRALGLVALLIGYAWLLRRQGGWLDALRARAVVSTDNRTMALRINGLFLALGAVLVELLFLALVYLVFDQLLSTAQSSPEELVLRKLVYAVAWYWLALAVVHRLLLNAVRGYRRVDAALNEKMLVSLRLVARFALGMGIYLILSKALLGRGALYGIALNLAWAGSALIGYRLIQMWRSEVAESYLRLFPNGRLAEAVRDSSQRIYGLAVALLAFGFVAVRGVWVWLRDTALSFEQTRKALAYLLRRRLERQAEKNTGKAPDPSLLPDALIAALSEESADPALRLDRYPQRDEVLARIHKLAAGERGALIALVGERGAGKTTWLRALAERSTAALPTRLFTLHERRLQPADLLVQLSCDLGFDTALDENALIAALLAAPPQVVLVDLAQNLMLRAVGGLDSYECLLRIARATLPSVLWVLAFSRWPFEFMQRLHPGQDIYDLTVRMRGWEEGEISDLIELRMKAAGVTADYSDLQLDTSLPNRSAVLQLGPDGLPVNDTEAPSDRYHRIVWDYADGNPRVALHFWKHSLIPDGTKRVKVRLFSTPPMALLEATSLRTRFLLAALVQHENLTAAEAARALRISIADCEALLAMLEGQSVLSLEGDRYRVDSHWNRAVLRFLQRKKLLVI